MLNSRQTIRTAPPAITERPSMILHDILSATRIAALAALLAASVPVPATAADIVVKHAQGETSVAQNPAKVVTFDYAALDTLDALGVRSPRHQSARVPEQICG